MALHPRNLERARDVARLGFGSFSRIRDQGRDLHGNLTDYLAGALHLARNGGLTRIQIAEAMESAWEIFLAQERDPFTTLGTPLNATMLTNGEVATDLLQALDAPELIGRERGCSIGWSGPDEAFRAADAAGLPSPAVWDTPQQAWLEVARGCKSLGALTENQERALLNYEVAASHANLTQGII